MSREQFKHLWIALYKVNIYYVKCDRRRYGHLVKKEFNQDAPKKEYEGGTTEIYEKQDQEIVVIWLKKTKTELPELVHEAFHAVHWILQRRGLWLTDSSEEAYAYLIQDIFKELSK